MADLLPCVEIEPKETQRGSVVWMHGLGADGHDFEPIVPMLNTPFLRFVFPHAPSKPVTINGGIMMPSWYDIRSLDPVAERENEEDVLRSAEYIEALIAREKERGVPAERIVLAGFSQGAGMALHVALRHPETLAGILALSGYVLLPEKLGTQSHPANRDTPLLQCHGTMDPLIQLEWAHASHQVVRDMNRQRDLEWHTFPMPHAVCEEEIAIVGRWLNERFADTSGVEAH